MDNNFNKASWLFHEVVGRWQTDCALRYYKEGSRFILVIFIQRQGFASLPLETIGEIMGYIEDLGYHVDVTDDTIVVT